jgi:uncharacterized protein (DUF1330 family)
MTVYAIIHTTVDDTETHHRQMVSKIMEAVERHGGRRIALGHGEQLRVHDGEPPNANRVVIHEFPDHESVKQRHAGFRVARGNGANSLLGTTPMSDTFRQRAHALRQRAASERDPGRHRYLHGLARSYEELAR